MYKPNFAKLEGELYNKPPLNLRKIREFVGNAAKAIKRKGLRGALGNYLRTHVKRAAEGARYMLDEIDKAMLLTGVIVDPSRLLAYYIAGVAAGAFAGWFCDKYPRAATLVGIGFWIATAAIEIGYHVFGMKSLPSYSTYSARDWVEFGVGLAGGITGFLAYLASKEK